MLEASVEPKAPLKDAVLDRLAEATNVAQFISFAPGEDPTPRYQRVLGHDPRTPFTSVEEAAQILLAAASENSVNVRSFQAEQPKSNAFFYGLKDAKQIGAQVRELAASGLYTIINETIDVRDGGVSGVSYGGIIEFAPDDTPRAVEKPGTVALTRDVAMGVLETVYGFSPSLPTDNALRVEFSVHPLRRGVRQEHTIVWEEEVQEHVHLRAFPNWPNLFSRLIGDKTFGLLIADALGLPVPRTCAITRRLAPFSFGKQTGTGEHWIRTAPVEQVPGRFTTRKGWVDPFELLAYEDPTGEAIAAVLSQEAVEPLYSGAAAAGTSVDMILEGVEGSGDAFMVGESAPEQMPTNVVEDVKSTFARVRSLFGPARFEWVHDGTEVWIVQLHSGSIPSDGRTIFPGTSRLEHRFPIEKGLEELRALVAEIEGRNEGVVLVGNVGVTSHLGDILRKARIPSRVSSE